MTKPRDPEALLAAYLLEGMEVLPERVVDAVLDEIHRTRQRPVFGSWRARSMFKPSLAVAAVAAVLVAGVLLTIRWDQPEIGDRVEQGEPLYRIHAYDASEFDLAVAAARRNVGYVVGSNGLASKR